MKKTAAFSFLCVMFCTLLFSLLLQALSFLVVSGYQGNTGHTAELAEQVETLKREVDVLYRQSSEVNGESSMDEVMHAIGYAKRGEQVFIFPQDISPDIPDALETPEPQNLPVVYRVLVWAGRPLISFLISCAVTAGIGLPVYLVKRSRRTEGDSHGNSHVRTR